MSRSGTDSPAEGLGFKIFLFLSMVLIVIGCFVTLPPSAYADGNVGDGHNKTDGITSGEERTEAYVDWGVGDVDYNTFLGNLNSKRRPSGYGSVFSKWSSDDGEAYNQLRSALGRACKAYNKDGKCSDTKVVAVGAVLYNGSLHGKNVTGHPATKVQGNLFSLSGNRIEDKLGNTTWNVWGTGINIWKSFKWHGKDANLRNIAQGNYGDKINFVVLILDKNQVNPKGWYPKWGVTRRADLASSNSLNTTELQPCAAYWYVTATGIDGYVKGKTTKTTQYITPYGKLWNAVQTGGTWTSATGKKYGPFKGDWKKQDDMVKQVKEARNVACGETDRMSIKYDYGNSVPGGVPSSDSVTITSKDDFLKSYAKGGVYKITKQVRNATITIKQTDVKVYERASMRVDFLGWQECTAGHDIETISGDDIKKLKKYVPKTSAAFDLNQLANWNGKKCGYIGKAKPSGHGSTTEVINSINKAYEKTSIPGHLNVGANGTIGMWYGNFGQNDGWILSKNQGKVLAEAKKFGEKGSDNKMTLNDGERYTISKVFNRGYPTKWTCKGKTYTTKQMETEDLPTAQCMVASDDAFVFQNEVLGEWRNDGRGPYWLWFSGGKTAFLQGSALRSDAALKMYNAAVKPVSNRLQSIHAVSYQDFVNINCNQQDFEAFVAKVRNQQTDMDISPSKQLTIKSSTKFNGVAQTGVITTADVPTLAEIVPRVLGSTMAKEQIINGLTIKDVTGSDNPTIDGQPWSMYSRVNGKYNVGYDASKDPVYSKECPFDCTADPKANRTTSANIDRTNTKLLDRARGSYGVRVNAKNGKGDAVPESNTANMQFFRNNEWNQFKVDVYTPVAGSNAPGQVSYDGSAAKSTVINRNVDGTPWFSSRGTLLTEFEGKRDGSYKPVFTADHAYLTANKDSESSPVQLQSSTVNTDGMGARIYSVQWPGQVNDFRIRSVWATENGVPLRFRFKWEYDAKAHVTAPDTITFIGDNGHPENAKTTVSYKTVEAGVDGKCLSQQNTLNPSPDTARLNHDSSGSGVKNVDDRRFEAPDYGFGARGWVGVTFVRATAE